MTEATETRERDEVMIRANTPDEIQRVIQRIQHVRDSKLDYVAAAKHLRMAVDTEAESPRLVWEIDQGPPIGVVRYGIRRYAHRQIAERMGVAGKYASRMLDEGGGAHWQLLADNVNHWLNDGPGRHFLLRTLDDDLRAMLGNSYRVIDDADIFFGTYDVVKEVGAEIVQMNLTDNSFSIRAIVPDWKMRVEHQRGQLDEFRAAGGGMFGDITDGQGKVAKEPSRARVVTTEEMRGPSNPAMREIGYDADWVIPGVSISNSETGAGRAKVEPIIYRHYCTNYALFGESFAQRHVGAQRMLEGILSEETIKAESAAIFGVINDVVRATFDREAFEKMVARMTDATGEVLAFPTKAVEQVVKHYGITDADQQRILDSMVSGGDPTVYGLMQAITATGRDKANPDRAEELERIGGEFVQEGRELVQVR